MKSRPPRLYLDRNGRRYIILKGKKKYIKSNLSNESLVKWVIKLLLKKNKRKARKKDAKVNKNKKYEFPLVPISGSAITKDDLNKIENNLKKELEMAKQQSKIPVALPLAGQEAPLALPAPQQEPQLYRMVLPSGDAIYAENPEIFEKAAQNINSIENQKLEAQRRASDEIERRKKIEQQEKQTQQQAKEALNRASREEQGRKIAEKRVSEKDQQISEKDRLEKVNIAKKQFSDVYKQKNLVTLLNNNGLSTQQETGGIKSNIMMIDDLIKNNILTIDQIIDVNEKIKPKYNLWSNAIKSYIEANKSAPSSSSSSSSFAPSFSTMSSSSSSSFSSSFAPSLSSLSIPDSSNYATPARLYVTDMSDDTVNRLAQPTPITTDLIRSVSNETLPKPQNLLATIEDSPINTTTRAEKWAKKKEMLRIQKSPAQTREEDEDNDIYEEELIDPEILNQLEEQAGQGNPKSVGLYNDEIDKIMDKYYKKGYKGSFALDEISKIPISSNDKKIGFVLNLDKSNQKGSHWVAIYIDAKDDLSVDYYDSYAEEPSPYLMKELKKLIDKMRIDTYLKFKINRIKQQSSSSSNCGYFSIGFLFDRFNGVPFKDCSGYSDVIKSEKNIEKFKKSLKEFDYI